MNTFTFKVTFEDGKARVVEAPSFTAVVRLFKDRIIKSIQLVPNRPKRRRRNGRVS